MEAKWGWTQRPIKVTLNSPLAFGLDIKIEVLILLNLNLNTNQAYWCLILMPMILVL